MGVASLSFGGALLAGFWGMLMARAGAGAGPGAATPVWLTGLALGDGGMPNVRDGSLLLRCAPGTGVLRTGAGAGEDMVNCKEKPRESTTEAVEDRGEQQEGVEGPELAERHQAALGDGRVVVEGEEKLMAVEA